MRPFLLSIGVIAMLTQAPVCHALTVDEFDSLPDKTKDKALQMIFDGTYNNLAEKKIGKGKLRCIARTFTADEPNSVSVGVKRIYRELEKARKHDPTIAVEDIVLGIMNSECF